MASRRDELNAYTFARKRTISAFLQPALSVTEEGAPRPLRAVLPGLIIGALILAGFGAWGMFKPPAPKGWDEPEAHVIVGSSSTTRYVVLKTDGKKQLHPVLNLASAKLLLSPGKSSIIKVKESVLDSGDIPRGPTLGIPFAPDRMPSADDARKQKHWAVCEQPGGNNTSTQKAVFLFADREADKVEGSERLRGAEVLYVQGRSGARYLVDPRGVKYLIGNAKNRQEATGPEYNLLLRTLFSDGAIPQQVTDDWLGTLKDGQPIVFPTVPGEVGTDAGVATLGQQANRVGMVLTASTGTGPQHYVVLKGKVARVSDFVANLLLSSGQLADLEQNGKAEQVSAADFTSDAEEFSGDRNWPVERPRQVNSVDPNEGGAAHDTVCSILDGVGSDATPRLGTWAGKNYPATIMDGATSAYVTPGTGLLYRQIQGKSTKTGQVFLVTDTGLRYQVQANSDSSTGKSKIGDVGAEQKGTEGEGPTDEEPPAPAAQPQTEANEAQTRLGYQGVDPLPVPANWSQFLPIGPRLDTNSARQPQGL
ncbi:type VII secretion protein EccB [Streptomyces sp. SAJ15]|uniref:type VII secretion protein EccB n=1 Tax=Streptomyces sp. SAJ15 TaxID=2011095 RepID=UPI001186A121|nr:type VII secretion protein EccB [Streptomyces sp. SAJ15]TVL94411.1 type VII secretion protein EccB [Streptomyces sp. SAJ15]